MISQYQFILNKMFRSRFLSFVFLFLTIASGKHLPTYITACKKNDPNLNDCALQNARKAMPSILKGDKEFKIPSFLPYNIPLVEVHPSNDMVFKLKDITLSGLDSMDIQNMQIDLDKRFISLEAIIRQTVLDSQYEVSGKLLSFALQGEGPAKIISDNSNITYSFTYDLTRKKGKDFIDINSIKSDLLYKVGKAHYKFDNLFGGNKLLSDNFNQFLNENSKEVDSIAGATNKQIVSNIVFEVFKGIFRVVPYDEIFV